MPSNTTTINFGAWPGGPFATTNVPGQTGLVATSRIEAWLLPIATADHSADEHKSTELRIIAFYSSDGVLTIEAWEDFPESIKDNKFSYNNHSDYGLYTVGWVWSNT